MLFLDYRLDFVGQPPNRNFIISRSRLEPEILLKFHDWKLVWFKCQVPKKCKQFQFFSKTNRLSFWKFGSLSFYTAEVPFIKLYKFLKTCDFGFRSSHTKFNSVNMPENAFTCNLPCCSDSFSQKKQTDIFLLESLTTFLNSRKLIIPKLQVGLRQWATCKRRKKFTLLCSAAGIGNLMYCLCWKLFDAWLLLILNFIYLWNHKL